MTGNDAAELEPLITREQAENTFRKALALFIGRGRQYSVVQVANAIGCKPKAIYDFIGYPAGHYDHRPLHFGLILSLTSFLGPRFTNEWLILCDQQASERGETDLDQLAGAFAEFIHEKNAAHHPEGECGPAIGPNEREKLDDKVTNLPIKGRD